MNNNEYTVGELFKLEIYDAECKFNELISWSDKQRSDFATLVNEMNQPSKNTKDKGDKLEEVVRFIIKNSFFYEVYSNVRTATNEIDDVIVLSRTGKIALDKLHLSRDLLPTRSDLFIAECKNYHNNLDVTYVGKFYSLLSSVNVRMGILFTRNGLTGASDKYEAAYGLVKILKTLEDIRNPQEEFYILVFTDDDYKDMIEGKNFFDILNAKKIEARISANYRRFIECHNHESEVRIKEIISEQ